MDWGTTVYFDFLAKTHAEVFPLFLAGCWISSWLVAALVVLTAALILVRDGRPGKALAVLGCFVLGHLLVEVVQLVIPRPLSSFAQKWIGTEGLTRFGLQFDSTFPSASLFLSALAWLFLFLTLWRSQRALAWMVLTLALLVVFGGFVCNLILARHRLTDLLAGLSGGAGMALVAWSFEPRRAGGTEPAAE